MGNLVIFVRLASYHNLINTMRNTQTQLLYRISWDLLAMNSVFTCQPPSKSVGQNWELDVLLKEKLLS